VRAARRPDAPVRLVCLPYGGGGASAYAGLAEALPEVAVHAVQPPGREDRIREAALAGVAALVDALVPAVAPLHDRPLALLGWSMGALVAFELARALARATGRAPAHLIVAAFPAPDRPRPGDAAGLLRDVGALDPALLAAVGPTLAADLAAVEGYRLVDAAPLPCPITAVGGVEDVHVDRDALAGWARFTRGDFTLRGLPGGHLLLRTHPGPLVELLRPLLAALAR
jgi:surfactin synthase thioesterase subunit